MPLPTGTVSFLFTDIEDSTRRWEVDASMPALLARHDEILGAVIALHDGSLVKHTGDGVMAVFASASSAASAAVDAQRALTSEIASLKVRMGVHTGEAEERDGDYFGRAPSFAAR